MADEPYNPTDEEWEAALERFAEDLGGEIDDERFRATLQGAVEHHPDREAIEDRLRAGERFYVKPMGDEFELRIGDEQSTDPLGVIPLAHVLRRPQG